MLVYYLIIPTQRSNANLELFDWSRACRKTHLYFNESAEPETTWTIFYTAVSKNFV